MQFFEGGLVEEVEGWGCGVGCTGFGPGLVAE